MYIVIWIETFVEKYIAKYINYCCFGLIGVLMNTNVNMYYLSKNYNILAFIDNKIWAPELFAPLIKMNIKGCIQYNKQHR